MFIFQILQETTKKFKHIQSSSVFCVFLEPFEKTVNKTVNNFTKTASPLTQQKGGAPNRPGNNANVDGLKGDPGFSTGTQIDLAKP